jgi:hypothetical protein
MSANEVKRRDKAGSKVWRKAVGGGFNHCFFG